MTYTTGNERRCFVFPSHPIPSHLPLSRKDRENHVYESKSHLILSHPTSTINSPSKPTLNILPPEINLHILLALGIRIHSSHQPLRPLQRALVALLRLSTHETDQVARDIGALALDVAKVLLDSAAQSVDSFPHFFGVVVVRQEVAAGFAGESGAGGDGGWVAGVGGELGFEGFDEVLEVGVSVCAVLYF